MNIEAAFLNALQAAGLDYTGPILADGQLHRIKCTGDHNPNAWYVLHADDPAAGIFGHWKTGLSETWKADSPERTDAERAEQARKIEAARKIRQADEARRNDAAASQAQALLDAAQDARNDHPYLSKKGVKAHPGVKIGTWRKGQHSIDNSLLIPLRYPDGRLATVQAIFPHIIPALGRNKDFLSGGKKTGASFLIGDLHASPVILISEGYATAATLNEATGYATVMAIDAGNLKPVVSALQALYPGKRLVVCADNDRATAGNPGLKKATAVAKASRARLAVPAFTEDESGSDFNDMAALHGLARVRQTVEVVLIADKKDSSRAYRENSNHTLPTLPTYSIEIQLDESYINHHASYTSYTVSQLEELDEKGHPILIESNAAAILANSLKNRFAFCRESLRWHLFTQTHWQPLTSPLIDEVVTRLMYAGAPHGFKARTVTAVLSLLSKGLLPLPKTARLNAQTIPFTNGLLDPVTRELTPISPDNALTWCLPYAYDPRADCPTVKAWLRNAVQSEDETENPDELMQFLRAWLAALLTGRADLQRFLHLLGPGGTGKGTFIRLAEALVGKQNATVTNLKNLETNRFETAALYGKRLVAVTDSGKYGGGIDVFKALTGQDPLRMEVKHRQQGATFIFDGLTLIASNEPLQFTDYTSAVERRRMTVEFSHQVSDDERADWDRQGGETAVLHREIPGVVNWVLALSRDEVTHLITNPPGPIQRANRQAMQHSNPVADWLMQCVESDPTHTLMIGGFLEFTHTEKNALGETESRTLIEDVDRAAYPNYRAWCLRYYRAPVSARRFSGLVLDVARTLGMSAYRGRNMSGMYLKGLRLRPKDGGHVGIHVGTSLIHVGSVESNQKNLITKTINYEANEGTEGKRPTNYSYSAREKQNDPPLATRILALLRGHPAGFSTEEITRQVGNGKGASPAMVEMVLNHLAKAGDVGRINGRWVMA